MFCNHHHLVSAQKKSASHSAFTATLQGQPAEEEKEKEKGKKSPYLCGEIHRFKDCPYLIESNRPKNWIPDQAIMAKIKEKLQRSP